MFHHYDVTIHPDAIQRNGLRIGTIDLTAAPSGLDPDEPLFECCQLPRIGPSLCFRIAMTLDRISDPAARSSRFGLALIFSIGRWTNSWNAIDVQSMSFCSFVTSFSLQRRRSMPRYNGCVAEPAHGGFMLKYNPISRTQCRTKQGLERLPLDINEPWFQSYILSGTMRMRFSVVVYPRPIHGG
jgi:hypothetical protein